MELLCHLASREAEGGMYEQSRKPTKPSASAYFGFVLSPCSCSVSRTCSPDRTNWTFLFSWLKDTNMYSTCGKQRAKKVNILQTCVTFLEDSRKMWRLQGIHVTTGRHTASTKAWDRCHVPRGSGNPGSVWEQLLLYYPFPCSGSIEWSRERSRWLFWQIILQKKGGFQSYNLNCICLFPQLSYSKVNKDLTWAFQPRYASLLVEFIVIPTQVFHMWSSSII